MRAAIEHAGAERGLLIIPRGDELKIQAEATTSGSAVTVHLRETPVSAAVSGVGRSVCHAHSRDRDA